MKNHFQVFSPVKNSGKIPSHNGYPLSTSETDGFETGVEFLWITCSTAGDYVETGEVSMGVCKQVFARELISAVRSRVSILKNKLSCVRIDKSSLQSTKENSHEF